MTRASFPATIDSGTTTCYLRARLTLGCLALAASVVLATGLAGSPTFAQELLDQSNAPANWGGGAHHVTGPMQQTVSPTLGCLTRVEVGLKTGNRGRGGDQLVLTVLNWNYAASPRELAKVTADVQEGFDGFLSFTMPGGGIEVPHQWLALQVNDSGKNVFWWKYQLGNPYPGGLYFFGGYGDSARDYLFKTYGRASCGGFSLSVMPNPVMLTLGGSSPATIGVARQGGFTGPVKVSVTPTGGVTASPASLTINGSSASTTLTAGTRTGSFAATAKGSATGVQGAQTGFDVRVSAAAAAPKITSVVPSVQQKAGTITVKGSNFDPICGANMVSFAGVQVVATACTAGTLSAVIPLQAAYGATKLKVTSGGRASNELAFVVARQVGGFAEISNDVLSKHSSRSCVDGTAKVAVEDARIPYVASYLRVPGGTLIGNSRVEFEPDFWYWEDYGRQTRYQISNIGGVGFSLCSTGLVFDAGNGSSARLFLIDLEKEAAFQASPHTVPIQVPRLTPPYSQNYLPRLFRSPDGTIILAVTAAPLSGSGSLVATFFDKIAAGAILQSVPITKPAGSATVANPAISATLAADNRIKLVVGSQAPAYISVP